VYGEKLVASRSQSGTTYHYQDHISTISFTTDQTGVFQSKTQTYPYGKTLSKQSNYGSVQRYTFTGKEDDGRLMYFGARYYDQRAGRFLSIDPLQTTPASYDYATGNPLRFIDPEGEAAKPVNPARELLENRKQMKPTELIHLATEMGFEEGKSVKEGVLLMDKLTGLPLRDPISGRTITVPKHLSLLPKGTRSKILKALDTAFFSRLPAGVENAAKRGGPAIIVAFAASDIARAAESAPAGQREDAVIGETMRQGGMLAGVCIGAKCGAAGGTLLTGGPWGGAIGGIVGGCVGAACGEEVMHSFMQTLESADFQDEKTMTQKTEAQMQMGSLAIVKKNGQVLYK
jgi:RHS repeat-associated protein